MKHRYEHEGNSGFEELALTTFAALAGIAVIVVTLALVLAVSGCSGDYLREKPMVTDLHKYCLEYPTDSACQGPNSK